MIREYLQAVPLPGVEDRPDDGHEETTQAVEEAKPTRRTRQTAKIAFPYQPLNEAIGVVQAIRENDGQRSSVDQLSSYLKYPYAQHTTFRQRRYATREFKIAELRDDMTIITPLGEDILNPAMERQARVRAFLNVALYKQAYETYRGKILPPPNALKRVMIGWGVPEKQIEQVYKAFHASAEQAGFFEHGLDKLVMPSGVSVAASGPSEKSDEPPATRQQEHESTTNPAVERSERKNHEESASGADAAVMALVRKMPSGSRWTRARKEKWLAAMKTLIDVIYDDEEDGS